MEINCGTQGLDSQEKGAVLVQGPGEGDDGQSNPIRRRGRLRKHFSFQSITSDRPSRRKGTPRKPSQSSSDTTEKWPETSTDTELYCLCHRHDDKRLMVQCDQCDCWYHGSCVRVSSEEITIMDLFIWPSYMGV